LRETVSPGERVTYNNVIYTSDGTNVRYKMGSIVGILDSPAKANVLADMDRWYRTNSYRIGSNDESATVEFKKYLDALRKVSEPKKA
jgi:hypothetical protein